MGGIRFGHSFASTAGRSGGTIGADTFEQHGRWLVVRILRDEFAFEGFLEDGLAQAVGAAGKKSTVLGCSVGN